jgi:hypothetical protein
MAAVGNSPVSVIDRNGLDMFYPSTWQNAPPAVVVRLPTLPGPVPGLSTYEAGDTLAMHWVIGFGSTFSQKGGLWGQFIANHPNVSRSLRQGQAHETARALRDFEEHGKKSGTYRVQNHKVFINETYLLAFTLNQGHLFQYGDYEVTDCDKVVLYPKETVYIDEIIWKVAGRLPPDREYTTHTQDWWYSHFTTELFPPLFQQYFFEVEWAAPP